MCSFHANLCELQPKDKEVVAEEFAELRSKRLKGETGKLEFLHCRLEQTLMLMAARMANICNETDGKLSINNSLKIKLSYKDPRKIRYMVTATLPTPPPSLSCQLPLLKQTPQSQPISTAITTTTSTTVNTGHHYVKAIIIIL